MALQNTKPQKISNSNVSRATKKTVNNIKNLNKQANNNKTECSQQIYVHIHIKKRAVSGAEEGLGNWEGGGERFGQLDKPCIFTLQRVFTGVALIADQGWIR